MTDKEATTPDAPETTADGIPLVANGRRLTEQEIAILREARDRRAAIDAAGDTPTEKGGAKRANDPTRYRDWEIAGRAIDFS